MPLPLVHHRWAPSLPPPWPAARGGAPGHRAKPALAKDILVRKVVRRQLHEGMAPQAGGVRRGTEFKGTPAQEVGGAPRHPYRTRPGPVFLFRKVVRRQLPTARGQKQRKEQRAPQGCSLLSTCSSVTWKWTLWGQAHLPTLFPMPSLLACSTPQIYYSETTLQSHLQLGDLEVDSLEGRQASLPRVANAFLACGTTRYVMPKVLLALTCSSVTWKWTLLGQAHLPTLGPS